MSTNSEARKRVEVREVVEIDLPFEGPKSSMQEVLDFFASLAYKEWLKNVVLAKRLRLTRDLLVVLRDEYIPDSPTFERIDLAIDAATEALEKAEDN